ncbi:SpoIIE family protein phosphatase [Blastococcus tunisiensis]|uniref:Serine phosphatase RsbU, regulator of sigma subunit n=1 Tax=Blastococcus tunisiensis TaxID=1798228 RepID=A0A1I2EKW3_9ACTN|nr:SpoIIE family protein phosphatase [Blastococcus sp. DSM 46838]SFE93136.1 Serine phosphatase RsbU, regulator of sigma subunit [Blastococcus sp. DSM 46838]
MTHGRRDHGEWTRTADGLVPAEAELEFDAEDGDAQRTLLELAVTAAGIGTFDWDLVTGRLSWDERLLEMFGYDAHSFDETLEGFNARLHPEDLPRVGQLLQEAIDSCGDYAAEYRIQLAEEGLRWIQARGRVLCDEAGTAVRLLGAAWDVTAGRSEQQAADAAARRAELLSQVAGELTEHLDAEQAVTRLARLMVPTLADWCMVTLVDDHARAGFLRGLRDVASWHAEAAMRPLLERYTAIRLAATTPGAYLHRALTASGPVRIPPDAGRSVRALLHPGEAADLIAQLAPRHGVLLPLRARGRTVGVLSLYTGQHRPDFSAEDLATAQEAAARAGLAVDNRRLFDQQRDVAETLQRSLLTAPPEPDHLQVVVRYTAAARAAQVGGDWYDAFLQPGGATVLVIGDVVGHDVAAAADMSQIRTIVRTLGAQTNRRPAALLAQADRVMQTLQVDTLATALVARLEQTSGERRRGVTRLRWSNAGHPPPIVLHPDGRVDLLTGDGPDLLLGVEPGTPRRESEITLDRDAVVLLYTDGLIERRDQLLDDGLQRLRRTLSELAGRDLDQLCDDLLTRLLPDRPEDDVALVAVRLHPQNAPRPAEAGPNRTPPNVPPEPPT